MVSLENANLYLLLSLLAFSMCLSFRNLPCRWPQRFSHSLYYIDYKTIAPSHRCCLLLFKPFARANFIENLHSRLFYTPDIPLTARMISPSFGNSCPLNLGDSDQVIAYVVCNAEPPPAASRRRETLPISVARYKSQRRRSIGD